MLKDCIEKEIKSIEDYWNECIRDMERCPERLEPDFKDMDEYRDFALNNRAASDIYPLRYILKSIEEMAVEDSDPRNREYFQEVLRTGGICRCTEGWITTTTAPEWRKYRMVFNTGGGLEYLGTRLPSDDDGYKQRVANAVNRTSEILGYSDWAR